MVEPRVGNINSWSASFNIPHSGFFREHIKPLVSITEDRALSLFLL
jgi:hypothetical protein